MKYPGALSEARLIRRYKRFLADVRTPDGGVLTIHCPNTGSMLNCREPDSRVWYTTSADARRKYPQTWQIVEVERRHLVGINTGMANPLVGEAIETGLVEPLAGYGTLRREVTYESGGGRADFLVGLHDPDRGPDCAECYVEVKNVSLADADGTGLFPDAVTERGQRHLRELMAVRRAGKRAMVIFCVSHDGVECVRPADAIDPRFGELLREAAREGVELLAYGASYDIAGGTVLLDRQVPVSM